MVLDSEVQTQYNYTGEVGEKYLELQSAMAGVDGVI